MKHLLKEVFVTTPIVMIGMLLFILIMTLLTVPKAHGCDLKRLPFGEDMETLSERYSLIDDEIAIKGIARFPLRAESFCQHYPDGVRAEITLVDNQMVELTLSRTGTPFFKDRLIQQLGKMTRQPTREGEQRFAYNWDNHNAFVAHYSVEPAGEGVKEYVAISSRNAGELVAKIHEELEKAEE